MNKTKTILVSGLVGVIAGGLGGFFITSKLQVSAKPSQSQAGLFIRRCATEMNEALQVQDNHADGYATFDDFLFALDAYNDCMGYSKY